MPNHECGNVEQHGKPEGNDKALLAVHGAAIAVPAVHLASRLLGK